MRMLFGGMLLLVSNLRHSINLHRHNPEELVLLMQDGTCRTSLDFDPRSLHHVLRACRRRAFEARACD